MCCVMPPASVETTEVSRIASSSEVLPWSTWPMIVTTGRARLEIGRVVLEHLGGLDLVGRVRDRDLALELGADQLDGVVGQRLRDADELAEAHHRLLDDGGRDARASSARSLTVTPDGTVTGPVGSGGLLALVGRVPAAAAAAALVAGIASRRARRRVSIDDTATATGGRAGAGALRAREARRERAVACPGRAAGGHRRPR